MPVEQRANLLAIRCFVESATPAAKGKKKAKARTPAEAIADEQLPEVVVLYPEWPGAEQKRQLEAMKVWASLTEMHPVRILWLDALSRLDPEIPNPHQARKEASGQAELERQQATIRAAAIAKREAADAETVAQMESNRSEAEQPAAQDEPDRTAVKDDWAKQILAEQKTGIIETDPDAAGLE